MKTMSRKARRLKKNLKDWAVYTLAGVTCVTALTYAAFEIGRSAFLLWYQPHLEEKYGIVIDSSNSSSYNNTDDIYCALRVLPEDVLESFSEDGWTLETWDGDTDAYFAEKDVTLSQEYKDYLASGDYSTAGLTRSGNIKEILIRSDYEGAYGTTIHEFAHFIDNDLGRLSETPLFAAIINRNDYITYESYVSGNDNRYCDTNSHEYFAVTFEDYWTHYSYVEKNYPEIAEYYNTMVLPEYE